jgi:hypothetical protein
VREKCGGKRGKEHQAHVHIRSAVEDGELFASSLAHHDAISQQGQEQPDSSKGCENQTTTSFLLPNDKPQEHSRYAESPELRRLANPHGVGAAVHEGGCNEDPEKERQGQHPPALPDCVSYAITMEDRQQNGKRDEEKSTHGVRVFDGNAECRQRCVSGHHQKNRIRGWI